MLEESPANRLSAMWLAALVGRRYASVAERFIRYSIAGAMATVADFAVLTGLVEGLGLHEFPGYVLAATAGFAVGATVSFTISYRWVFADRQAAVHHQLAKFLVVAAIGVLLNAAIMTFTVERLGWWYVWGKAVSTALVLLYNFTFNSLWSFRRPRA